jgi:hypothetical protein
VGGQNDAIDPNQTSISTRKRDILRARWVSNRTGESRDDEAKTFSEASYPRDYMRGELGQHGMRVAKTCELRA